jgi:hypothetical protein
MNTEIEPIDYDDLKRRISEAIGKTFHELAAERGVTLDEFREHIFARFRRESRLKAKREAGTRRVKRKVG